jgi:hypothetical protein
VWGPPVVPAGTVTLTDAVPLVCTGVGVMLDVRRVPVVGSSSRNVTVWPALKLVRLPLSVVGVVARVVLVSVKVVSGTVTAVLWAPSVPSHCCCRGVTA